MDVLIIVMRSYYMKKILLISIILIGIIIPLSFAQEDEKEMVILPDGNVGIGTETPSEKLEVDGNIKCSKDITAGGRYRDATGFIMPVGSVLPFAGVRTTVPEGWLLCDGTAYSSENYPDLYAVIYENYGDGSVTTNPDGSVGPATVDTSIPGNAPAQCDFNVPDLRGQFLRGVDAGSGTDPDAASRGESKAGSNTGNAVGSSQKDMVGPHTHTYRDYYHNIESDSDGDDENADDRKQATRETNNPSQPHSETRPKNVYVNFIIKY
jgi:microcystin-dependent protein